jgi:hypothetical protein
MSSTEPESITEDPEQGTERTVTRNVSVQQLIQTAQREVSQAGTRPTFRTQGLRHDELSRPSVSLAPGNIEGLDGYDDESKGYVADAVTALDTMHQTVTKIIEAREASKRNPSWTEGAQIINTAVLADKLTTQTAKMVDATLGALQTRIAHVEGELRKPMDGTLVTPVAVEVRQYARELSATKRNELIADLIDKGDAKTLGALLTAPPFLSGLTDAEVKVFTEKHNRKANPLLTKRLALMKTAHAKLADAGSLFIVQSERAQGVPPNVVAQLRAAQSKAEAAFR